MFDWAYKLAARGFAFILMRNPVTRGIIIELSCTQYELDELRKQHESYVASSTRLIQACADLHNYFEQLGQYDGVLRFSVSDEVAGSELYAEALRERLNAFRAAALDKPFEKQVNCTDMFTGQELWSLRHTDQTLQ